MTKMNQDVPIEGVVKWLVRERDRAEERLEQVTGYAKAEENFYLYQMYKASTSYDEEFRKVTGDL